MFSYKLGFLAFVNSNMRSIVGEPLENEQHVANGDGQQRTTRGLLVWRKLDNWTAFTDGYRTRVSGPNGIEQRLNTERFPWESDGYRPLVYQNRSPSIAGGFDIRPRGVILHGSRSGKMWSLYNEFHATRGYAQAGAGGLAWNLTVGDDVISEHLAPDEWGWNAREWSDSWLAVEFAQPTLGYDITDRQVRAFAWWFGNVARRRWPDLPAHFIGHSETPPGIRDGKTDPHVNGSLKMQDLRCRVLRAVGG